MRIARVIGKVVTSRRLAEFPVGAFLICDALDGQGLVHHERLCPRTQPMPESLIVYDDTGAREGDLIAVSEGREASMPWYPTRVPNDAYCAAILDRIDLDRRFVQQTNADHS